MSTLLIEYVSLFNLKVTNNGSNTNCNFKYIVIIISTQHDLARECAPSVCYVMCTSARVTNLCLSAWLRHVKIKFKFKGKLEFFYCHNSINWKFKMRKENGKMSAYHHHNVLFCGAQTILIFSVNTKKENITKITLRCGIYAQRKQNLQSIEITEKILKVYIVILFLQDVIRRRHI